MRRLLASCLVLAALCGGAASGGDPAPAGVAAPEITREIRVRVACDEEWRAATGGSWAALARDRVEDASAVYERRFGIRWKVVDVVSWKSDDAADTFEELDAEMQNGVSVDGVDFVLGLSGQTRGAGCRAEYGAAGLGAHFERHAIVRRCSENPGRKWYVAAVVHELGHVLGAWHSDVDDSVMRPGESTGSTKFDPQAAAMIELMHDFDFAKGVAGIDPVRRAKIDEIFRSGHARDAGLPYADAELRANWGDVEKSRAACRRALRQTEACCGPEDPAVADCLRELASTDLWPPVGDLSEAEGCVLRARRIDPRPPVPLRDEALLADVAWARGRRDVAEAGWRRVYAARLEALGATNPETIAAKTEKDRHGVSDVRKKPWIDVRWKAPAPPPAEAGLVFEAPRPGTIHVGASKSAPSAAGHVDAGGVAFDVVAPSAGTLTAELIETGGAAPATHRASSHVDARSPTTVRFEYASVDTGAAAAVQFVGRLVVGARAAFFGCAAATDASACVLRQAECGDGAFAAFPDGPTTLFSRQWIATPGRGVPTAAPAAGEDALLVDGVRVSPDGAGAKRAWRLVLTFVAEKP